MNIVTFTFKALFDAYRDQPRELFRQITKAGCTWDWERKIILNKYGKDVICGEIKDFWYDHDTNLIRNCEGKLVVWWDEVVIASGADAISMPTRVPLKYYYICVEWRRVHGPWSVEYSVHAGSMVSWHKDVYQKYLDIEDRRLLSATEITKEEYDEFKENFE